MNKYHKEVINILRLMYDKKFIKSYEDKLKEEYRIAQQGESK